MSDPVPAADELRARTRRLVSWQIVTGLVVAAGFYLVRDVWAGVSAGYGGLLSIVMALLLSLSVRLASQSAAGEPGSQPGSQPGAGQWILYAGAGLRFVLVLALLAVGLALVGFDPIATVAGFAAVQLVFLVAAGNR